jgi:hypothetical protein
LQVTIKSFGIETKSNIRTSFAKIQNYKLGFPEVAMKNTLHLTAYMCVIAWFTSVWCEEIKLDPGVVNDWMRASIMSESSNKELKRIVYSSTLKDWHSGDTFYLVRYEVENSSCKRTLTLNFTDFHGKSYHPDWVKPIEEGRVGESFNAERPRVLVRTVKDNSTARKIMDLDVEYQVQDGMPVLVVANQQDVIRTLREFETSDYGLVRISAFNGNVEFSLRLKGFADKESWLNEHCPLDSTGNNGKKEVPAS